MSVPPSRPRHVKRCPRCQALGMWKTKMVDESRDVSGHLFVCALPARECTVCAYVDVDPLAREESVLRIAGLVAGSGLSTGVAFRLMRKAVGLRATELGHLLDVAPETISRWEREKRAVDRGALALVAGMVRDRLDGRTATIDGLRRLNAPNKLPATSRIELGHAAETSTAA